jgi:two-component system, OmpR family, sensor kinase
MNATSGGRLRNNQGLNYVSRSARGAIEWLNAATSFRRRIPIRGRIALFGAAVVAITVIVFSLVVYYLVQDNLLAQQERALEQRGDQVWLSVARTGRLVRTGSPFPCDLNRSSEIFYQLVNAEGASVGSTCMIGGLEPEWQATIFDSVPADHGVIREVEPQGGPQMRVYFRALSFPGAGVVGYVLVGQSQSAVLSELDNLRLFLIAGILLSLLGAGVLSWLVAGRALRPLDAMAGTAEDIGRTQDLSRRLPSSATNDEVGRLQRSFNQMLGQLEDAYLRLRSALLAQRRFVADASHELRTPLTTIRGNVGLLLRRDDITPEDRVAAISDIASESDRMSRMVQDLLTLARADAGYHLEKVPLDLRPILQEVSRQAQALQPARRVELLDGQPALVRANSDAIKQLLWILIDNAFKHTGEGGHISVMLQPGPQWAALSVSDDGPGIPAQDLERIFERFYQSDTSRTGEGTGLGLAIARWIAQEHGGRVYARNNPPGGARFTVELPVAAKS